MNIVQLHEKVRFWIDVTASPRFDQYDIDNALNTMIDQYVEESYSGDNMKEESFQKVQRLRDRLGILVEKAERGTGTGLFISVKDIEYRYLLAMKVSFGTDTYRCDPLTYDQLNVIEDNPFRRTRKVLGKKAYYIEENGMIRIIPPIEYLDITTCEIYYLANPDVVSYGIELSSGNLPAGQIIIATATPTTYLKEGVNYQLRIGDQYTPVGGEGLVNGSYVKQYTNCNLRSSSHEEIALRAAALLLNRPVDVLRNKAS